MESTVFDDLERTLAAEGPTAAIDRLCASLKEQKDYHALFYALLLRKRHELGVSPLPTAPSSEPARVCRCALRGRYPRGGADGRPTVHRRGQSAAGLWLLPHDRRDRPDPRRPRRLKPAEDEDIQPLVQIAFYRASIRERASMELNRYGICNAITTLGGQELANPTPTWRTVCKRWCAALYAELRERLTYAIEQHEGKRPPEADAAADTPGVVRKLIQDRAWLFEDSATTSTRRTSARWCR